MLSVPICDDRKNHRGYITIDITGSVDQLIEIVSGYGKSLCYQFPSVMTGRTTVVISPLISLVQLINL